LGVDRAVIERLTILAPGSNLPPMKSLKDYSMVELRQVISIKEPLRNNLYKLVDLVDHGGAWK